MNTSILYYLLVLGIALILAAFLYYFPKKKNKKVSWALFFLRFLSLVALLTLFVNPKWERESFYIEKPQLVIAVDNSASIAFVKGKKAVQKIMSIFKKNAVLHEKFDVKYFQFGEQARLLDSLTFSENQTNPTALIQQIDALFPSKETPVFLITDGNQTLGNSYLYTQTKNPIYPVVVGDTTQYVDLAITQINVNKYSFLDNQFPVEIFTSHKGTQNTDTQLSIYQNKNRVFTKKLQFSKQKPTQTIDLKLPAKAIGNQYYRAVITPLSIEKNTQNNKKDFSVEVVDQQTEILILSSFSHPDLGALKNSIESNKQRKASIIIGTGNNLDFSKYHLLILYQPTANQATAINKINSQKKNVFIITGTQTDWHFLNKIQSSFTKRHTKLTENYLGVFNANYSGFVTKDIGFEQLPPLKDIFGSVSFRTPYETLLFQKIGNTTTESPLLASYTQENQKNVILFGEGFWRWRMQSKVAHKNNQVFDEFWGAIFQYLVSNEKQQRLHIDYKKLLYSNEEVIIKASFVDKNFQIDTKASIWFYLTNKKTKETKKRPFYLENNHHTLNLSNLNTGNYSFSIKVLEHKEQFFGSFKILDYNIEQQFNTADLNSLQKLAEQTGGKTLFANTIETNLQNFLKNDRYKSLQKSKKITKPLIDWYWLLGFIILSLSTEWFIRKYRGLV